MNEAAGLLAGLSPRDCERGVCRVGPFTRTAGRRAASASLYKSQAGWARAGIRIVNQNSQRAAPCVNKPCTIFRPGIATIHAHTEMLPNVTENTIFERISCPRNTRGQGGGPTRPHDPPCPTTVAGSYSLEVLMCADCRSSSAARVRTYVCRWLVTLSATNYARLCG